VARHRARTPVDDLIDPVGRELPLVLRSEPGQIGRRNFQPFSDRPVTLGGGAMAASAVDAERHLALRRAPLLHMDSFLVHRGRRRILLRGRGTVGRRPDHREHRGGGQRQGLQPSLCCLVHVQLLSGASAAPASH